MSMSNLTTRVLVALVGIPLVVGVTLAGGYWFFAFILLMSVLALRELYDLARAKGIYPQDAVGYLVGVLMVPVFFYDRLHRIIVGAFIQAGIEVPFPVMAQEFLILLLAAVPVMMMVELFRGRPNALANIAVTLFGAMYVSAFFGSLLGIRELFVPADFPVHAHFPNEGPLVADATAAAIYSWGGWTVLAILASIWVCDSAAYFAGRAFGKHKLFERVSPKKTWEGAIAGFLGAVAAFLIVRALVLPYLTVPHAIVCGTIVGIFGQTGDLVESLLKRDAGIKDSSALIPGHGGVLDRFDSLLFVSPLLFLYLDFIVF
jgi:phosphatidate cytidylyltransferase